MPPFIKKPGHVHNPCGFTETHLEEGSLNQIYYYNRALKMMNSHPRCHENNSKKSEKITESDKSLFKPLNNAM